MDFTRRSILAGALALPAAAALGKSRKAAPPPARSTPLIDGLSGVIDPYAPDDQYALSQRAIAEMRVSGVNAVNQTVGIVGNRPRAWEETMSGLDSANAVMAANPGYLMPIRKVGDFAAAKAQSKLGVYYCVQDTSMVGPELDRLAELKAKGVRQVQLTYNLRNLSGDGSLEPGNAGISILGRKTIERIEAERLVLDLSHGGARTQMEAAQAATRPPMISHTGCRALFDHPRNTHDAVMKLVADKGGCVGIYFMPYLAAGSHPTGADLIAHIEHMANLCGEDHISIGSDGWILPRVIDDAAREAMKKEFAQRSAAGIAAPGEGPDVFPLLMDYNSLDKFDRLASVLGKRGWSAARIDKFYGTNLLRVYGEIWD